MRYLVTGSQMKKIDSFTIGEIGILSLVLMERAAYSVVEETEGKLMAGDKIWVACGTGNNGADGVAVARMLYLKGFNVTVLLTGDEKTGTSELKDQLSIAKKLGVPVIETEDFIPGTCDVLIDAVFGVGLNRNVSGAFEEAMKMLGEQTPRLRVAVDIPSGIHSDTGAVMGTALPADLTVTFGYEKLGTVFYPGKAYSGQVVVKDIGFPACAADLFAGESLAFTYEESDLSRVPKRSAHSNKGTFGKVLIVAGSSGMCGAAYLSALAAYRTGAGLVKIMTAKENRAVLQGLLPEAVMTTYDPAKVMENKDEFERMIVEECGWAGVVVLGPGLGKAPYVLPLVELVLANAYVPVILDADGLNVVAENPYLTNYFTENIIITPHLGEMGRLTRKEIKEIQADLAGTARTYSDIYGATCVLKEAVTVVAHKEGQFYVNTSGNSCMAKAGAGDVLTGVIAGFIALGLDEFDAAALGVYVHGRAGDKAFEGTGAHGLLARELADYLI